MKYLCLAYADQESWDAQSRDEQDAIRDQCRLHQEELEREGRTIENNCLKWGATTVRVRNGKLTVTDGPFAETKERVGGFFFLEARDLNEAIQVVSRLPGARMGEHLGWGIEVREIEEIPHI
jgi:hypothetical protein